MTSTTADIINELAQRGLIKDPAPRRGRTVVRMIKRVVKIVVVFCLLCIALSIVVHILQPAPAAVSFSHSAADGSYVRTADGVAEWDASTHSWTFCPTGWTDIECGA